MYWLMLMISLVTTQTEYYVVANIQGKALALRDNVNIEVTLGLKLYPDDKIHFSIPSTIIRLAGKGGTFTVKQESDFSNRTQKSSDFWSVLRNGLLPTQKTGQLKSRAGLISNEVEAEAFFKPFSDKTKPLLILDTLLVEASQIYFTDTASNFFYLSYKKGQEEINKKIPWKKSHSLLYLSFDQRLMLVDGKKTGNAELLNTKLYFFQKKLGKSFFVSDLNIKIFQLSTVLPELCILAKALDLPQDSKNVSKEQVDLLVNYLNSYYASIDAEEFIRKYLSIVTAKKCLHE